MDKYIVTIEARKRLALGIFEPMQFHVDARDEMHAHGLAMRLAHEAGYETRFVTHVATPEIQALRRALMLFMNLDITAGVGPEGVVMRPAGAWYDDYVAATAEAARLLGGRTHA